MASLRHTRQELLRSHDYARPHLEGGRRLHGGFDADGRYISPRLLVRGPAVEAWTEQLRSRGGELLPADASLLEGVRFPTEAQTKLLIREGLGQFFWNTLTITGMIEARGRLLAQAQFPDLQAVLVEDVASMAVGHLNGGLLEAHGIDEGGEPEQGIGGHDEMWFVARDLAFGPRDWPIPEVPATIGRPDAGERLVPGIAVDIERMLAFLANLLMIEFRAELNFSSTEKLMRDPELFTERSAEAERAAEIVGRIRADERIHVDSLRLYLGELRTLTFKATDGGTLPGTEVIDPLWSRTVQWATLDQPKLQAAQQRPLLRERIREHAEGERILAAFDALGDA